PTVRRASCRGPRPAFSRPADVSLGLRGFENASMRQRLGHVEPHVSEGPRCATCPAGPGERAHEVSGKQHDAEMPESPACPGLGPAPSPARPGLPIPGIYLSGGICREPQEGPESRVSHGCRLPRAATLKIEVGSSYATRVGPAYTTISKSRPKR